MAIKGDNFDDKKYCKSKEYIIFKAQEILKAAPPHWANMNNSLEQAKIAHQLTYLMSIMNIKRKK